jgi:Tol biopolymer transport system component/DNA-binding winged helix-turn-helix (wHTH) protein
MADKISFGVYELDPDARELRKRGVLIRLQDQAFRILATLIERPGEIVTRDELQNQIWGKDTFVDFDQSLNKAVNRIREALNDDANTPRYVETVPRRGYRFIAPVQSHEKHDAPAAAISDNANGAIAQVTSTPEPQPLQPPTTIGNDIANSSKIRWRIAFLTIALALIAFLILATWLGLFSPQPRILKSTQLTNDGMDLCSCQVLVTDGSRIYFSENNPDTNQERISAIPVTGGEPTAISVPTLKGSLGIQDISPDHDRLLVWAGLSPMEGSLWSVPLAASTPRPLGDVHVSVGFNGIRWSPDGQRVVYADGSALYLAQGDGSEPTKLLTSKGIVSSPVWSPDGRSVRFLATKSATSGVSTLLEIPAGGGVSREVIPGWQSNSSVCFGNWTPDAKYFLFLTDCSGRTNIWAIRESRSWMDLGKRDPVLLTSGPMRYVAFAFSSDSKKIFIQGFQLRGDVERYDRKSVQFVPLRPALSADCCVYSKDGQWMAYVTFPGQSLWRSKPDGSERQELTWPPMNAQNPNWSPDGKEIAFSALLPGKTLKTFIIAAQGGQARELTHSACSELDANWSPDGAQMIFASPPFYPGVSCPDGLQTLDLKTNKISTVPGSEGLWSPRWSPDGKSIVALNTTMHALMINEIGSSNWHELVTSSETFGFPQWSGNGSLVYYFDLIHDAMYSVRVKDHTIEKVADISGIPTTGAWGNWNAVTPDGSPLILRDVSLNEIYALDLDAP